MSTFNLNIENNYKEIEIFEFSDSHNEYRAKDYPSKRFFDNTFFVKPNRSSSVYSILILAGDIFNLKKVGIAVDVLNKYCQDFDLVLYVFGNHEYYGTKIGRAEEKLKEKTKHLDNLYILQNDKLELKSENKTFTFLGTTLWVDFDHSNENQHLAKEKTSGMNGLVNSISDFTFIKNASYGALQPYHIYSYFKKAISFLEDELSKVNKDDFVCVITHHSPSLLSSSVYKSDDFINPVDDKMINNEVLALKEHHQINKDDLDEFHFMYSSNLDDFIFKYQPDIWFHGHIHKKRKYFLNKTLISSNPIGIDIKETDSVFSPDRDPVLTFQINN